MAEEEERRRQEKQAKAEEAAKAEKQAVEDMEDATQETGKTEEEAAPEGLKLVFPPLPTRIWVPPPEVPTEKLGTGTNTKVHFNFFNTQSKIIEIEKEVIIKKRKRKKSYQKKKNHKDRLKFNFLEINLNPKFYEISKFSKFKMLYSFY